MKKEEQVEKAEEEGSGRLSAEKDLRDRELKLKNKTEDMEEQIKKTAAAEEASAAAVKEGIAHRDRAAHLEVRLTNIEAMRKTPVGSDGGDGSDGSANKCLSKATDNVTELRDMIEDVLSKENEWEERSMFETEHEALPPSETHEYSQFAKALFDYDAMAPNELSLKAGMEIELRDTTNANWWSGSPRDRPNEVGFFPTSWVKVRFKKKQRRRRLPEFRNKAYADSETATNWVRGSSSDGSVGGPALEALEAPVLMADESLFAEMEKEGQLVSAEDEG